MLKNLTSCYSELSFFRPHCSKDKLGSKTPVSLCLPLSHWATICLWQLVWIGVQRNRCRRWGQIFGSWVSTVNQGGWVAMVRQTWLGFDRCSWVWVGFVIWFWVRNFFKYALSDFVSMISNMGLWFVGLCYGLSSSLFTNGGLFWFCDFGCFVGLCFDFSVCDLICDLVGFWVFVVI